MNNYETICIIKDDIGEKEIRNIVNKVEEQIANNGLITKVENLGKKKLAYDIKGYTCANYFLIEFEAEQKEIDKLEKLYRTIEEILKFIVVKKEK